MLVGIGVALVLWLAMGSLIVRQRIPAFIITLGGLLIFKGLFWLVIQNHTIPVVVGGKSNLYSLLTTYYLPPTAGYALAAVVAAGLILTRIRARTERRSHGFPTDDTELTFLKLFLAAQLIFLFVVVTNQFRGIPLPALILGVVALAVFVLTQHTPFGRYLYAIGGNEEAAVISGIPVARVTIGAFAIMGVIVAITGFLQTAYSGASTTTIGDLMELDAVAACVIGGVVVERRTRHRARRPLRRAHHGVPAERHDAPRGRAREEIHRPRPRAHPRRLDGRAVQSKIGSCR